MTLRGSTSDFPLESVIGLLAGTSKTGELQVRGDSKVGALGFASGRLVAAVMEGEGGDNALGAIFAISQAEFEFTPWESAPEANLEAGDLVSLLKRAAEARDRISAIRALIPDDRTRFRLSEKAADQGAVTFTPDRWRALLAVNGERDVAAVAEQLRLGKMQTLTLLSGLVKDGVIEPLPPVEQRPSEGRTAFSTREPSPPRAPEPAPPAPAPPAREWSPPAAREEMAAPPWRESQPAKEERARPAPEWKTSAPDWTAKEPAAPTEPAAHMEPAPHTEPAAPAPEVREDLAAEIAQRMGGFGPAPESSAPTVEVPSAVDDRLSSLSGLFAPGPAANASAQPTAPAPEAKPKENDWWRAPGGGVPAQNPPPPKGGPAGGAPAESWTTAPPASKEAPANAWAPTAKPKEPPPTPNPWAPPAPAQEPGAKEAPSGTDEWAPPPQQIAPSDATDKDKKKAGGFLGRFRRDETPTPIPSIRPTPSALSITGKLASLSNALLMEYNSGGYGKGKIETRLANLLMRVDEQADPIDRPLPVVDDLIDAAALEREGFDEKQAVPYLATLVRQIYEDAERAFGKDKAKKGYKVAQEQVVGGDASALQSPELAGKLPKV
ncbi:MAG TPA: DUF4388 domain-containing protein [Candidatus Limnocylindria bacterium]|nr:DUF4388 domain-containing protein [Candidatus Limnocylindria bacterium]